VLSGFFANYHTALKPVSQTRRVRAIRFYGAILNTQSSFRPFRMFMYAMIKTSCKVIPRYLTNHIMFSLAVDTALGSAFYRFDRAREGCLNSSGTLANRYLPPG
jgi:hypothetical protein